MTIKEYQTIIEKTAIYPKNIGIAYCALGLTGEAGEVAEKIKKLYRDKQHLINYIQRGEEPSDVNKFLQMVQLIEGIKKELGDVIWYVTALANEFGISLEDIMESNYNKLIKRKETNTLHGSGDNREEV